MTFATFPCAPHTWHCVCLLTPAGGGWIELLILPVSFFENITNFNLPCGFSICIPATLILSVYEPAVLCNSEHT